MIKPRAFLSVRKLIHMTISKIFEIKKKIYVKPKNANVPREIQLNLIYQFSGINYSCWIRIQQIGNRKKKSPKHREGYQKPSPVNFQRYLLSSQEEDRSLVPWLGPGKATGEAAETANRAYQLEYTYCLEHKDLLRLDLLIFIRRFQSVAPVFF